MKKRKQKVNKERFFPKRVQKPDPGLRRHKQKLKEKMKALLMNIGTPWLLSERRDLKCREGMDSSRDSSSVPKIHRHEEVCINKDC